MPDCSRIDRLVTPYVDEQLPADEQRQISAHVAACPPCRAKVAAERAVRALVQARRAELTPVAAPPALKARCAMLRAAAHVSAPPPVPGSAQPPGWRRAWRASVAPFAAAAMLILVLGVASLYQATRSSSRLLAAELALDHEKCFRLNRLLGTEQRADTVQAAMSSGFDWNVQLPDTSRRPDVSLVGSRPCLSGEGRVAHIMYTHNGEPVSLFMLAGDTRPEQVVEVLGHRCRIWSAGGRTFVLIARESAAEMDRMVALVRTTVK